MSYNKDLKEYDITEEQWNAGKDISIKGFKGKIISTDNNGDSMIAYEDGGVIIDNIKNLQVDINKTEAMTEQQKYISEDTILVNMYFNITDAQIGVWQDGDEFYIIRSFRMGNEIATSVDKSKLSQTELITQLVSNEIYQAKVN